VLCAVPGGLGAQEDFESFREQQRESMQEFRDKVNRSLKEYQREIREAFSEYKAKAAEVWGGGNADIPDREKWVSYRDGMRERRIVNFKQGTARFEIALPPGREEISESVRDRLVRAIVETVTKGPDKRSIRDIVRNPDSIEPGGEPLLAGLLQTSSGETVDHDNAEQFARDTVRSRLRKSEVRGEDTRKRSVASVEIPMIPSHIRKRAERYEDIVKEQARTQSLRPELVFAIIETESFFNPRARSHVPAFGLMQLVPVSGGRHAYRLVHGVDKKPSEELLYQPKDNVQLGTAYFHYLYFTAMKGVRDAEARLWCAVASYNTGPGNLFRTFSQKGKSAAIRKINSMSSEEVFRYLARNLPYEETRSYIRKVRKKMPKYRRL
jgi:membrane-bound lytic murein transglycosylase C